MATSLLQILGLRPMTGMPPPAGAPATAAPTTAPAANGAPPGAKPAGTAKPGADGAAGLATAKKAYDDARAALEAGDLSKVPDHAAPGTESAFAALTAARKALRSEPKTAKEYATATQAIGVLAGRAAAYLAAEAKVLDKVKARFEADRSALDADLAEVPPMAPKGLEALWNAVTAAQQAVPPSPATVADYVAATRALPALKKALKAFLKAQAKQKRIDDGIAMYGSSGSKLADLAGSDKLNDEQKRMLDEKLSARIAKSGKEIPEAQLKQIAERIVEKTNKLAETPLEKKIPGINEALAKSDTLKTNIVKLQAAKWKVKVNKPGGGSYCDKVNKVIAIDPSDPLADSLGGLAHETGHALYTPPPGPTMKASASGLDYVQRNTESNFLDEGEAQFVACRASSEGAAQGEAMAVPADSGVFAAIYVDFTVGTVTQDEARRLMAKQFGNLVTSTTGESYVVYYGGFHVDRWNAAHKKVAAQQLDKAILTTLVLFP